MPISDSETASRAVESLADSPLRLALTHPYCGDDGSVGRDIDLAVETRPWLAVGMVVEQMAAIGLWHVHTLTFSGDPISLSFVSPDGDRFVQVDLHHRPNPNAYLTDYEALVRSSVRVTDEGVPIASPIAAAAHQAMKAFYKRDQLELRRHVDVVQAQGHDSGHFRRTVALTEPGIQLLAELMVGGNPSRRRIVRRELSRASDRTLYRFRGPRSAPAAVDAADAEEGDLESVESRLADALGFVVTARSDEDGLKVTLRRRPWLGVLTVWTWLRWRRGSPVIIWQGISATRSPGSRAGVLPAQVGTGGASARRGALLERVILTMRSRQETFVSSQQRRILSE